MFIKANWDINSLVPELSVANLILDKYNFIYFMSHAQLNISKCFGYSGIFDVSKCVQLSLICTASWAVLGSRYDSLSEPILDIL